MKGIWKTAAVTLAAVGLGWAGVSAQQTGRSNSSTPPVQPQSDQLVEQMLSSRRSTNTNVAPVFEGWEPNEDGTFTLYFGYMNRNWEEALDVPVGPNNFFSPGEQDRGQPEHFLIRRHKKIFGVVVPKDFGTKELVWTITSRGRTDRVPGSLKPMLQIDVSKDTNTGNVPPQLDLGPDLRTTVGQPLKLSTTFSDDGLPKYREPRVQPGASPDSAAPYRGPKVNWAKYRGPGVVKFSSTMTKIENGKAETTVTFSTPGTYVIQAFGDDGSAAGFAGFPIPDINCCWTIDRVTVHVTGTGSSGGH